jgi:hypothetical protein
VSRRRLPWHLLWVLLILGVTALMPTVVLPRLTSDGAHLPAVATIPGARGGLPASAVPSSPAPTGFVVVVAPPATRPPPVLAAEATRPIPDVAVATAPPPGPAFAPLVYEAEHIPPSAESQTEQVELYEPPGPDGVRFTKRSGWIEFRSLGVTTAGVYRITVIYAPDGGYREMEIRGAGKRVEFGLAPGPGCCATASVEVSLSAGGTVRIEPDQQWRGVGLAIDRIIVEHAGS